MKHLTLFMLFIVLVVGLIMPVSAQDDGGYTVVADGLVNPRQISYDANGNLYIVEAGNGGTQLTADNDGYGASGQVTVVSADGTQDVFLRGFISYLPDLSRGLSAIHVTDESIWVLLGESTDITIPLTHALLELDPETYRIQRWVDLLAIELETDPDGNPNEQSHPTDFDMAEDGTFYIANAGCNCLMAWNEADGLSIFHAWDYATDNPVPTSVQIGPDGNLYVGFLTGFPFPQDAARIEVWSTAGELVQTYTGLNSVTDVLVTDEGTIYAVEIGESFDSTTGWTPGRVVMVSEEGVTPVMSGLNAPYGLAQGPDGTLVVSLGSFGGSGGQVIVVE